MLKAPKHPYTLNALKRERAQGSCLERTGIKRFETRDDAIDRNMRMLRRFARLGITEPAGKIKKLKVCHPNSPCENIGRCPAACHLASRIERARLIVRLWERLRDSKEEIWHVTVVNDAWRQEKDGLERCRPSAVLKWFDRRLDRLEHFRSGLRGVIGVEASVNERAGEIFWQPHIHALLEGLDKKLLRRVLKLEPTNITAKPVVFTKVKKRDLAGAIGYVLKRTVEKRVAYVGKNGRQDQRGVKVPADCLAEYDSWLLDQLVTERFRVIGMRLSRKPLVDPVSFRPNVKAPPRRYDTPFWVREDEED